MDLNAKGAGVMKPVGVVPHISSTDGGVNIFFKKKLWLRIFHMVTFQDTNKFLLTPLGTPFTTNQQNWYNDITRNGFRDWHTSQDARLGVESTEIMSLGMLCLCPWIYKGKPIYRCGLRAKHGGIETHRSGLTVKEAKRYVRQWDK